MNMEMTRREFFGTGTGAVTALSFSLVRIPGLTQMCAAAESDTVAEIPVIWTATGSCTGCSVSLLNSASPSIQELLLDQVLPGKHLSLAFHTTVMAAAGELAGKTITRVARESKGGYILVVDGATATADEGRYCIVGEVDGRPITGYEQVRDLGRDAMAVLAVGTCASFGGIPAADPNPTGCTSIQEIFTREGIETPVVNIPGCPPHPDWIVGTIATILLAGLEAVEVDQHGRPTAFFGMCIHDNCQYRGHYDRGEFAEHFGEHGCLLKLGCKGPITHADCPVRKFNDGTNWCVQAGHPCIGCVEPEFPYGRSMFDVVSPTQLTPPALYPVARTEAVAPPINPGTAAVVGGVIGAAVTGAAVLATKIGQTPQERSAATEDGGADEE